jgi:tryptophan synthase alpha chain
MNRVSRTFAALRGANRKGLVGYLTAGDPDVEQSFADVQTAIDNGVDILELGVPFSDPTADGPVIQAAAMRALAGGMNLRGVLRLVRRVRAANPETPIVLFGYANPFFRYGYKELARDAADAGVDGVLVVDMPFGAGDSLADHLAAEGICTIPLIAPTTPRERAEAVLRGAQGFVYYIMVKGVTGVRGTVAEDVTPHVQALRGCTDLPVAVGFGVSTGEQARAAAASADAVVVGSALVKAARENRLGTLVRELRAALDGDAGT